MTLFCLQLVAKGHVKFNQKLHATNLVCHCSRQYLNISEPRQLIKIVISVYLQ